MSFKIIGLFCVSVFAVCAFIKPAYAAETQTMPNLEVIDLESDSSFLKKMQVFEDTPFDDETLAYRLLLPKNWSKVETDAIGKIETQKMSLDILGVMASFFGPPQIDDRSFFTIQALNLDYDITMEGWFLNFSRNNGYSVEAMDIVSEDEVQARYVEVKGSTSYRVRLVAKMNGDRVIVARYFVPQQRFDEEKLIQEQVVRSFTLTSIKKKKDNNRNTYGFLDQSFFDYPKTWELNAARILSIERMKSEVRDISPSGDMNARIRVYTISRLLDTGLGEEVKRFLEEFKVDGYKIGDVIERHSFPHHAETDFAKTEVYKLLPDSPLMLRYELWATVLKNDDYYYIVTLLAPTRDQEFFVWSRSSEVYKIVLSTLRRYE